MTIGTGTIINYGCVLDGLAPISLGVNCGMGMGVMILTSTHEIGGAARRFGKHVALPMSR